MNTEVLIVGGGLVGSSLAVALASRACPVVLVEEGGGGRATSPSYDDRAIALAQGSRRIFEAIGLWDELASGVCPIRQIHISDRGHFGFTHLDSRRERVDALGYVALARELGRVLEVSMAAQPRIERLAPARLVDFVIDADGVTATLNRGGQATQVRARLLVACDGAQSEIRERLGLETRRWEYGQSAVIANVTPALPHGNIAYERFTDTGPMAVLPMPENRCSLVWTTDQPGEERLLSLSDEHFREDLQQRFGWRLGRFIRIGRRSSYPLALLRAHRIVDRRVVLVGNSAHTLHPVAGQGFNLGLRDVAVLAGMLGDAIAAGADPGADDLLQTYAKRRQGDQLGVAMFTDGLARLFSNPLAPLSLARNLGLVALDLFPAVKHEFARHTMGLAGGVIGR